MSSEELKPCPFCGGRPIPDYYVRDRRKGEVFLAIIQCGERNCMAALSQWDPNGGENLIKAWNKRSCECQKS